MESLWACVCVLGVRSEDGKGCVCACLLTVSEPIFFSLCMCVSRLLYHYSHFMWGKCTGRQFSVSADSWRIWFVLVRVHVCVHAMTQGGSYLASSVPEGEMTPGYAHAEEEGEALVNVPERCSFADRLSLHSPPSHSSTHTDTHTQKP